MKVLSILKVIMIYSLLILGVSGCGRFSDTKTFVSTAPAPEGFDAWSFFWSGPQINPEAEFDFVVIETNEKEYAYWNRNDESIYKGSSHRSDFSEKNTGVAPSELYNREIRIIFRVNKGEIKFDITDRFYFKFFKGGFDGEEIEMITAALE